MSIVLLVTIACSACTFELDVTPYVALEAIGAQEKCRECGNKLIVRHRREQKCEK